MKKHALTYRPEVDGLRAVAVTAVIGYHAAGGIVPGGFVGVDVFFVISGFLITTILLRDLHNGEFSLAAFYERRCRRILPPLAVMAAVTSILAWGVLMPLDYREFGRSVIAAATFWANLYFYKKFDYFDTEAVTKPLLHTWSLSIEEQFYIAFPLLLLLLHARWKKAVPAVLAMLFALSLYLNILTGQDNEKAAFYLLQARAWELLLGSLVALWPRRLSPSGKTAAILSPLGLALICRIVFAPDAERLAPAAANLFPCLGAAMFILAHGNGRTNGPAGRLLTHPVMTGLGKISYSLYLWHWPLLALPRYSGGGGTPPALAGALLLALALSWLSWRFVERPIRSRQLFPRRSSLAAASLITVAILAGGGALVHHFNGFAGRLPVPARYYAEAPADQSRRPWNRFTRTADKKDMEYSFEVYELNADRPTSFMILGDSHAVMWLAAIEALADERGLGGILLDSGVSNALVLNESVSAKSAWSHDDYREAVLDFAVERGVKQVLVACRYTKIFGLPILATTRESTGKRELELAESLEKLVAGCRRRGIVLWFAENVPEYPQPVPRTLVQASLRGLSAKSQGYAAAYYENRNAPGKKVLEALVSPDFRLLEVKNFMCPDGWCAPGDENGAYYFDNSHLTRYGALRFRDVLRPMFDSMSEAP